MSTELIGTKEYRRICAAFNFHPNYYKLNKWMRDDGATKVGRYWKLYEFKARQSIMNRRKYLDAFTKNFSRILGAQAAQGIDYRPSKRIEFTRYEPLRVLPQ